MKSFLGKIRMKTILVTGGAGYIGSAIVKRALDMKYKVLVIDNLLKGRRKYVDKRVQFFKINLCNKKKLHDFFRTHKIDCVIHCAARKSVGESEEHPQLYFEENVSGTINLLNAMIYGKCKKIIFSSTACVYKENLKGIYNEDDKLSSQNIYGFTKIKCEEIIKEFSRTLNMKYVIFRYFNVAGDIGLTYQEKDSQNIFPVLCESIRDKKTFFIFGNKYNTIDGTGVRDYIHLSDVVSAHIRAINYPKNEIFNLGTKKGTSVLQIIKEFENQLNRKINFKIKGNRAGDVGKCLANPKKAKQLLNWEAKKDLKEIVCDFVQSYNLK